MQCRTCQYEVPQNMAFCPNCGSPAASPAPPTPGGIAPTVLASSPNQGMPASYPTYPPQPAAQQPYTPNYAESAPPPPVNMYITPSPYGAPQAAPPPQYGVPQQGQYGAPPVYGVPQQGQYGTPPPMYGQPRPPKKTSGWVSLLVFVLLVAIIAGGAALFDKFNNSNHPSSPTSITSNITPTTGTNGDTPDVTQIKPSAAANITAAQSAGAVDSHYRPTDTKSSFTTGDTVYITMTLAGNSGYATMKVYRDSQFDIQSDSPLALNSGDTSGAFSLTVNNPGQFVVGLYWCTHSDCSDAALAKVVNFDVS